MRTWIRDSQYLLRKSLSVVLLNLFLFLTFSLIVLPDLTHYWEQGGYIGALFDLCFKDSALSGGQFILPIGWLLLHVITVFDLSHALWRDHISNGVYVLLAAKSRTIYFLSKLAAVITATGVITLGRWMVTYGALLWSGGGVPPYDPWTLVRFLGCFWWEDVALVWLAYAVSLYVGYRAGFGVSFTVLAVDAIFPSVLLIGQGSMPFRYDLFQERGFSFVSTTLCIVVWLVVCGGEVLLHGRRYDFMQKE